MPRVQCTRRADDPAQSSSAPRLPRCTSSRAGTSLTAAGACPSSLALVSHEEAVVERHRRQPFEKATDSCDRPRRLYVGRHRLVEIEGVPVHLRHPDQVIGQNLNRCPAAVAPDPKRCRDACLTLVVRQSFVVDQNNRQPDPGCGSSARPRGGESVGPKRRQRDTRRRREAPRKLRRGDRGRVGAGSLCAAARSRAPDAPMRARARSRLASRSVSARYPGGGVQGTRCRRRIASVPAGQTTSRSPSSHRSRAIA